MNTGTMQNFESILLKRESSILDAIRIIDGAASQIALVVDAGGVLLGTVTDGDIRRGILKGIKLEEPVTKIMNEKPRTITVQTSPEDCLSFMMAKKLHQIPVIDSTGRVAGLVQLDDLLKKNMEAEQGQEDVHVVLMLGGQGERLLPLTQETPKPMLSVGDKPLLETIVGNFAAQGFRKFYFSVNYKADVIERHFGDGSRFGIEIAYLRESQPMGTAGALGLLPQRPEGPMIVMNGDILTSSNFRHLIDFHRQNKALATMCVREYEQQVPYGIVQTSGTTLQSITEKPVQTYFVNAGIYVIDPQAFDFIPAGQRFDMPQLFDSLKAAGKDPSVFPIREYWLDIGRHEDLARARAEYGKVFGHG